ncbi:MAG: RnfABCDGE type electron transport complex subunit G [Prevotellaceae bacterium]|nr:RnfABCDGE type electron transport complex subunit G [Prevotellaceae bacterium]
MKKLESTWYNMVIVLTVICIVAGAALGFTNSKTATVIEQIKEQQLADGIKEVLNAEDLQMGEPEVQAETGAVVYRTDHGTAVQATDPKGFGGALTVLVGFDDEGHILGYRVMESSETPGLGAKAQQWFQKDGKGNIIGLQAGNLTVKKDGGEVDAITASTITSRAFLRCVNAAYGAMSGNTDVQSGATSQAHSKPNEQEKGGNENE